MTPWTVAHQSLPSMGFPRQEYWSGLAFPSPGALPDPGIKPASLVSPALTGGFFITSTTWEALCVYTHTHVHVHVCVCMCNIFCLLMGMGCLHVLAIVNSAVVNIGVCVSFKLEFSFFLDICPGVRSLNHMVTLCLAFLGTSLLFFIVAVLNYFPTNSVEGFPFLHNLSSIYYL